MTRPCREARAGGLRCARFSRSAYWVHPSWRQTTQWTSAPGGMARRPDPSLALLPLATTVPSIRTLAVVVLGSSAALGALIDWVIGEATQAAVRAAVVVDLIAAAVLAYAHLWAGPHRSHQFLERALSDEASSIERFEPLESRLNGDSVVVVARARTPSSVLWAPFNLQRSVPRHWWVLSQTSELVTVVRTSANAVDVSASPGPVIEVGRFDLFRDSPLGVGDTISVPGLRATILFKRTPAGNPLPSTTNSTWI